VGLNGLEMYDQHGHKLELSPDNIEAEPRDVNVLATMTRSHDPRTLDKVYDGVNNTYDDHHMWLPPECFEGRQPEHDICIF